VTISIRGDKKVEADEWFVVNLSNVSRATLGDAQGVGTILNDDSIGGTKWARSVAVTNPSAPTSSAVEIDAALMEWFTPSRKRRR
jgi:hypothetical protein